MQTTIEFSKDEIEVLLYALNHLLRILQSEDKGEKSSVGENNIAQMIQKMTAIIQILAGDEDGLTGSDLLLCLGALLKLMEYLEVSIPFLCSAHRNDAIDMKHKANRLAKKLKPYCEPVYLKMYPDNN